MATSLIFAATLVAVVGSTHLPPFGSEYGHPLTPAGPKPVNLFDEPIPSLHQTPIHARIAQEASAQLIQPHHNYIKHFNHIDAIPTQPNNVAYLKAPINPLFPQEQKLIPVHDHSFVNPESLQSFDDAIVQAIPKKFVTPQAPLFSAIPQAQLLNQVSPLAKIAVLEDEVPVTIIPLDQSVYPQSSAAKYIVPHQAIAQGSIAQPSAYFLEDETPIALIPEHAKTFQTAQHSALIPQEASVRLAHSQQYLAQHPTAQPLYFLEDETPIGVKTFQPVQHSVFIPQEASVRLAHSQQYLAQHPTAQPLYFLEDETPIGVKTFQPAQSVLATIPTKHQKTGNSCSVC